MSYLFRERHPPPPWHEFKRRATRPYMAPAYAAIWLVDCAAFELGKWPLIELLEYLGSFSILFAAIVYFADSPDRLKQKHYQAWQVINTAQGKGGNGGRIDALDELNRDHISLIGVNVSGAYLQGVRLKGIVGRRANFSEADLRDADFRDASLPDADLHFANFRDADLRGADLSGARLDDCDLAGANLAGADLADATLDRANLRGANLHHLKNWQHIKSLKQANIQGVLNPPDGFIAWARTNGATESNAN